MQLVVMRMAPGNSANSFFCRGFQGGQGEAGRRVDKEEGLVAGAWERQTQERGLVQDQGRSCTTVAG
jgi:hypothetical protein